AMELADVAEAERSLARNESLVAELGQPTLTWATLHHRAALCLLHGEPDAQAAIDVAREYGESAHRPGMEILAGAQQFWLLYDKGRLDEMEPFTAQLAEQTRHPLMMGVYAFVLSEVGQADEAARVFDELAATDFAHPTNNVGWLHFHAFCALVCGRL